MSKPGPASKPGLFSSGPASPLTDPFLVAAIVVGIAGIATGIKPLIGFAIGLGIIAAIVDLRARF